jgi:preprotein translocase subunit SecY
MFSGGAIGHLALFSLGIAPYITASIVVQLLTKVYPSLEVKSKEELRKLTLYATVPICLLEAAVAAWRLSELPGLVSGTPLLLVAGLTAGSLAVVWLGEQISERGLGNGASILIMAGIVVQLPALIRDATLPLAAFYLVAVVATVFLSQAQRRIPLQKPAQVRGRRLELGGRNYLPLKVLTAGVMPIVFASALLAFLQPGGFPFTVATVAAILFLSYFWTYAFMSPSDVAHQLRESGSAIPGIRPGDHTARYLNSILGRITLCGAVGLALLALLPGGSALLIVVGVGLDLFRKLEAALAMHHYPGFLK